MTPIIQRLVSPYMPTHRQTQALLTQAGENEAERSETAE